jgi:hypothetical protein
MRIKLLVIVLVVFVLAVAMLAPVAAQNTCVTSGYADESHGSSYTVSAWENESWWLGGSAVAGSSTSHSEAGNSNGWSSATYGGVATCDMGGGAGYSTEYVEGEDWGNSNSVTTVNTYSGDVPNNGYTSDSTVVTNEDWWSDFDSGQSTTWSP